MIITFLSQNSSGFWLSLGGVLLIAELIGAGGYLLWSGVAALLMGGISAIFPLSKDWQAMLFAIITVIIALLWWWWIHDQQKNNPKDNPLLNQRNRQLIGMQTTLENPIVNGRGRLRINDSSWQVYCRQDLPVGALIEVIDVKSVTLIVKAI